MTRHTSVWALATAFAGASLMSGIVATPIAHADPLDAIINTVNSNRPARCPALRYDRGLLEGAAQTYARSENPVDGQPGYNGRTLAFLGSGDPQAAAINSAYTRGAGNVITNCDFTEFGVGFIRHEDREVDVVTMVFGAPAAPAPAAPPVVDTKPEEKPAPAADPAPAPVAPKDAVTMRIAIAGLSANVDIASSASIPGSCSYTATAPLLPTVRRTVDLAPNGSASLTLPAPPPLSTYHVVLSCKGQFNGQTVEFGHVEQDVTLAG
jgi:hypothetical protein